MGDRARSSSATGSASARRSKSFERWLDAAREGSSEALGRMLDLYRRYLLKVAERSLDGDLRPKGGASDLVQQSYLEAARDFGQFQGRSEQDFRFWLRQILLNNVGAFRRHYHQAQRRDTARELSLDDLAGPVTAEALPAPGDTPCAAAIRQERADRLDHAMRQLPVDYQQVIELRQKRRLSFSAIARQMERSEGAVQKLWARALERLQVEFANG